MSQRLQMLQVARLARRTLGDAAELVVSFLHSLAAPGGGFCNRAGRPDLYYTSFAIDALVALDAVAVTGPQAEATRSYLDSFGDGSGLDFVHRCCLARAWASQPADAFPPPRRAALLAGVAQHRAADGGYNSRARAASGTAYGCFLAMNAHADLRQPLGETGPEADAIAACVRSLRTADGGFANSAGQPEGSTTATAAAIATLRGLGRPVPDGVAEWLLARRHPDGGFTAAPDAPVPDLLSTAVALHALDALDAPWREHRESMLDFLDTLWTAEGAFHGSWADDEPDAEYTFYGLVALGHCSV
ncbi:MAG: prenyltransferase/squalene oxidase repeat-containing protein [Planctomycetia bacterium]